MLEGEGAEAWKAFSEHCEPKTATRYVGMLRQILLYDFRDSHNSSIGLNSSGTWSGSTRNRAAVTDNVRQDVFQAGIKDASIRDHLALHAGRLNS